MIFTRSVTAAAAAKRRGSRCWATTRDLPCRSIERTGIDTAEPLEEGGAGGPAHERPEDTDLHRPTPFMPSSTGIRGAKAGARPRHRRTARRRNTTTNPHPAHTTGSTDARGGHASVPSRDDSASCHNTPRDRSSCTAAGEPTRHRYADSPRNRRSTARRPKWHRDARTTRPSIEAIPNRMVRENGPDCDRIAARGRGEPR